MEFRPFYFAREWISQGHNVTVLAASESHVRNQNPKVRGLWLREKVEQVQYTWLRTPRYSGNGLGRVLNMLVFVLGLFLSIPYFLLFFKPKVIIASSTYPLDIFPAWCLARLSRARLVFEVHDLWPLSPIELGGMSPRHPFITVMQHAENFAYRHCDWCVSLLPQALEHMAAHGLSPKKFVYVPNGIDVSEWENSAPELPDSHRVPLESFRKSHPFLVGYVGTHGLANALHTLCDSATELHKQGVGIVLVGSGPEKEALVERVARAGLSDHVLFLPPVAKQQVPTILGKLDLLYIGLQRQSLFRFGISPNKMFDYMMAEKPIIQAIECGNNPVESARCGVVVPPEDSKALVAAIGSVYELDGSVRSAWGHNAKSYVLREHAIGCLAKKMLTQIGMEQ
jgi:glycosyltransferase involved in cell wall biosynthesis